MLLFTIGFTDGYSYLSAFGGFMELLVDFLKTKFLTFSPKTLHNFGSVPTKDIEAMDFSPSLLTLKKRICQILKFCILISYKKKLASFIFFNHFCNLNHKLSYKVKIN